MAKSQTQPQNDTPFNIMNNGLVKYALFALILLAGTFRSVLAQYSISNSDGMDLDTVKQYPSYCNSDGSVDSVTVYKMYNEYLGRLDYPDTIDKQKSVSIAKRFLDSIFDFSNEYENVYKIRGNNNQLIAKPDSVWIMRFAKIKDQRDLQHIQQLEQKRMMITEVSIGCLILLVLLVVITIYIYRKRKKAKTGMVVRNVTTTVLKKQCLDDVANNENYLIIEGKEFSDNTAIGKMYIKNECIKGIYDMYAEDIRKSASPNENGCMVLGRWVYNQDVDKYDVSLEELVFPGNDAVFSQYEISFGGIIRMKIFDRLRQLRQETDLQYDVTCWVHSHPNLGVFFSKADCNAHLQLKQPSHPRFLTAFVVDILTPIQELGIFTFRQDANINSRAELKHLYSLKEWYNWALESERKTFRNKNYYNTLTDTKNHDALCCSIHIGDKAMGDICEVAVNNDESLHLLYGSSEQNSNGETEFVADILSKDFVVPDKELVGAFVVDLYCSIPSVRKAVVDYLDKIKFVLVYSTSNKILTSIPVINNDLCEEISCYGEQKLEDLILWTER